MTLRALVEQLVELIDNIIPVLGALALVFFLFNVVRFLYKSGDVGSKSQERAAIGWGLLALFVLFSVWGILRVLMQVFPLDTGGGGRPGNQEVLL